MVGISTGAIGLVRHLPPLPTQFAVYYYDSSSERKLNISSVVMKLVYPFFAKPFINSLSPVHNFTPKTSFNAKNAMSSMSMSLTNSAPLSQYSKGIKASAVKFR
jgi:hypothetical protein